jgi:hypothetical protein
LRKGEISPDLRFQPDVDLITAAPFGFQLLTMPAWLLFAAWPFTRRGP